MKKYRYIVLLLSLAVVWACGGGDDSGDEPNISKDFVNVTPNVELLGDGQTVEINIQANCDWTITKDADWLSVIPSSGNGSQRVSITAGKNTTGSQRLAVLTVKGESVPARMVTVTQTKSLNSEESSDPSDPENPNTTKEPNAGDNLPPS